jgi:hypothetical protein
MNAVWFECGWLSYEGQFPRIFVPCATDMPWGRKTQSYSRSAEMATKFQPWKPKKPGYRKPDPVFEDGSMSHKRTHVSFSNYPLTGPGQERRKELTFLP